MSLLGLNISPVLPADYYTVAGAASHVLHVMSCLSFVGRFDIATVCSLLSPRFLVRGIPPFLVVLHSYLAPDQATR
jgi:hypothetical protein